jgi:hypothetical protein
LLLKRVVSSSLLLLLLLLLRGGLALYATLFYLPLCHALRVPVSREACLATAKACLTCASLVLSSASYQFTPLWHLLVHESR